MRPPCLRKAVRSAAMVSLVRLRPTSLALLGRADRCEVLLGLRGMESPCRWFTVAALALRSAERRVGKRVAGRVDLGGRGSRQKTQQVIDEQEDNDSTKK